jgi:ArsR family transcriptional regulator, arsenate/arsenite/antimonite-responsive transcriptional repressor
MSGCCGHIIKPAGKRLDSSGYFHSIKNMKKTDVIVALAALAHESRLDVFRYLMQQGAEGAAAGDIAVRLGLPAATLSFHLSSLRHAGLVANRRVGRSIIYAANFETMNALLRYLTENCCQGHPEACMTALPHPARGTRPHRPSAIKSAGQKSVRRSRP